MKRKKLLRSLRYTLLGAGARGALFLARSMPRRTGLFLFGLLGTLVYLIPNRQKKWTLDHLRMVFGHVWDEARIRRTARSVFSELGKNLFDAIHVSSLSKADFDRIVIHEGMDEFREAYGKGAGVFVITAHIGCFEMLLHFFARHGFKSFAVGKKLKDPRIDEIVRKLRSGPGIEYFDRSEGGRKMIRLLKAGWACGVLVDQDTSVEGVFADFLGRPAFTPSGPVQLAMRCNIPMFVVTTVREQDDRHRVLISREIVPDSQNNFDEELVRTVQRINGVFSDMITRHPCQWVWMHRRWRTQRSQAQTQEIG